MTDTDFIHAMQQGLPPITAPISLADAALAEAHMTHHEAINGLCAEETNDDQ